MDLIGLVKMHYTLYIIKKSREIHQHTFGPMQSDGFQYCDVCGHAYTPGCQHVWEKDGEFTKTNSISGSRTQIITRLRCKKCGEMKEHVIS